MEYVTEKMRNKDVYWYDDGSNYILSKYNFEDSTWSSPIMTYDKVNRMYLGTR